MANEILQKTGTQITFADHATDFVGGAAGSSLEQAGSTDVQLDTTNVADTAARQGVKVDLGATRAAAYSVVASFELAATPTAGEVIEIYWSPSPDATAANGNPGGASGADAAYTGDSSNLAAAVKQLQFVGVFVCTEVPTAEGVQTAYINSRFTPAERYGSLIIKNESGAAFHSDAVESHLVFDPIIDEVQ